MKEKENSYATNKGGFIKAPRQPSAGDPKATKTIGKNRDLRGK